MGLTMHRRGYAQARAAQGVCVNACVCVCLRLFKRCHLLLVRFPSIVIKAQDSAPRTAPEERNHAGTWNVSSLGLDALGGVTRTKRGKESHGGDGVCVWGGCMSPLCKRCQRFQLFRCSSAPLGSPFNVTVTHSGRKRDTRNFFESVGDKSNSRTLNGISSQQVATPVKLLHCLIWTGE